MFLSSQNPSFPVYAYIPQHIKADSQKVWLQYKLSQNMQLTFVLLTMHFSNYRNYTKSSIRSMSHGVGVLCFLLCLVFLLVNIRLERGPMIPLPGVLCNPLSLWVSGPGDLLPTNRTCQRWWDVTPLMILISVLGEARHSLSFFPSSALKKQAAVNPSTTRK